jgi:hypothetical protein
VGMAFDLPGLGSGAESRSVSPMIRKPSGQSTGLPTGYRSGIAQAPLVNKNVSGFVSLRVSDWLSESVAAA